MVNKAHEGDTIGLVCKISNAGQSHNCNDRRFKLYPNGGIKDEKNLYIPSCPCDGHFS